MKNNFARRQYAVRVCAVFGVLWCSSCKVYDPDRLDQRSVHGEIRTPSDRSETHDASTSESDASDLDAADGCGDGVVGDGETCDIAIARGNPGACPDGCSGGQACLRNVLEGEGCHAHCAVIELTEAASGDGCCPPKTAYYADDDCPARCGNEHLEPGEMCDPSATCPSEAACVSDNACLQAHFVGAADTCDARCDMTPIQSCVSGDGCCPAGCDHGKDSDCPETCRDGAQCPTTQVQPSMPAPPAAKPPEPPAFVCADKHSGGACKACDCAKCTAEVEACVNDSEAADSRFCAAAIDCSEDQKCNANQCYCGSANADSCASMPKGVCLTQWEDAARSTRPSTISFLIRTPGYTVNHAVSLIDCRAKNCSAECGIEP